MKWNNGIDKWAAKRKWHSWWAWHPVSVGTFTYWLEPVMRRRHDLDGGYSWWEYDELTGSVRP